MNSLAAMWDHPCFHRDTGGDIEPHVGDILHTRDCRRTLAIIAEHEAEVLVLRSWNEASLGNMSILWIHKSMFQSHHLVVNVNEETA